MLSVAAELHDLFEEVRAVQSGEVATYIPALGRADPDWFAVSLVTVDGHRYDFGDVDVPFTIQSVSKPFVYGMALEDLGLEAMSKRVGVEPSGDPFNAIELDLTSNRPHNAMINAGAILTTSLLEDPHRRIDKGLARFAGRELAVDEDVWESEQGAGDRNRAIAWLMRNFGMLTGDVDAALDAYFRECSVLVDARDLATMAATLAHQGVNPVSGERALAEEHVPRVLSVMGTCGMYDYAGEWLYRVGLPAKSGVSGAVVAVLPGRLGVAAFSPRLDAHGNSVRGMAFCEALSSRFGLHLFAPGEAEPAVVRRSYASGRVRSKRQRVGVQRQALDDAGDRVRVLELQGGLHFATCEVLDRVVEEQLAQAPAALVLDITRLRAVDDSVRPVLWRLRDRVRLAGVELAVAGSPGLQLPGRQFPDVDAALEHYEDAWLGGLNLGAEVALFRLADVELLKGLDAGFLARLEEVGIRRRYLAGDGVFTEGDPATSVYFVLSGRIDLELYDGGEPLRAASVGPGGTFGDLAVLGGVTRSAGARAVVSSTCFEVEVGDLLELAQSFPEVLPTFYVSLAHLLAERLRRTTTELRAMQH